MQSLFLLVHKALLICVKRIVDQFWVSFVENGLTRGLMQNFHLWFSQQFRVMLGEPLQNIVWHQRAVYLTVSAAILVN